MAIAGFYWLDEQSLAGSGLPGRTPGWLWAPPGSENDDRYLDADLGWLVEQGIGAILTLTVTPLSAPILRKHGLRSQHLPIHDMSAPRPAEFLTALDFIDEQHSQGRAVLVHCHVGEGRTGSILAAWLIRQGATPQEALTRLRSIRPGAVSSYEQQEALIRFAARREWIV